MSAYRTLEARFKRRSDIQGALAVLHWDRAAMMPPGGNAMRGEQIATLKEIVHEILADPTTAELLESAGDEPLDEWQAANLREMRRIHAHATALEPALVAALARATSRAEMIWREARPKSDYELLRPALEEVVLLTREEAQAKGDALGLAPYDALLDAYEPGLRPVDIDAVFEPLAAFLPDFLERVLERQTEPLPLQGPFPVERQKALGLRLMTQLGFDFDGGRLDESAHPFCGGVADDVRITTRYDEADFTWALMAVLHETGHALYNAALPEAWRHQPVGGARSMAVHESQSLLVEMQVCRSPAFFRYLSPLLGETFGRDDAALSAENLYRRAIRVGRGFIRVDADEVTYPLHVILRYRLEKALVEGRLELHELPEAWNRAMADLLGITPPNDRLGCLQDIHWPGGAFGYFPCYTLGALLAAQLFEAVSAAEPDLMSAVERGDFRPLVGWLRATIHEQGKRWETPELIRRATGRPLGSEAFLRHLEMRYLQS